MIDYKEKVREEIAEVLFTEGFGDKIKDFAKSKFTKDGRELGKLKKQYQDLTMHSVGMLQTIMSKISDLFKHLQKTKDADEAWNLIEQITVSLDELKKRQDNIKGSAMAVKKDIEALNAEIKNKENDVENKKRIKELNKIRKNNEKGPDFTNDSDVNAILDAYKQLSNKDQKKYIRKNLK